MCNFLSMHQSKEMLRVILEFFCSKNNPAWQNVESVVIDKDFVEWAVLQEVLPKAAVLLCQFHTLKWWKGLLSKRKHDVKEPDQVVLERYIREMVYANTQDVYLDAYASFIPLLKKANKELAAAFDRNWHSCREMWSVFGRSRHFTAGNSTTNRIEAWLQLKYILGRRVRIDRTLKAILKHDSSVLRDFLSSLATFQARTRVVTSVPPYLRKVAAHVS